MAKKTYQADEPCVVCGTVSFQRAYHHIYTRKARPHLSEAKFNRHPVCLIHHQMHHAKGLNYMAENYPSVQSWLIEHGWEFDQYLNKWTHPMA